MRIRFIFGLLATSGLWVAATGWTQTVTPISDELREKFQLDEFYQQHVVLEGMPIVGSEKVSAAAIREAAWIVNRMIGHRPEILRAMAENNTRLAVMAYNEYTTDIPEHRRLKPRIYWDRRARGLGATRRAPAVSCAEENLLCHPGDPYNTENILIHEFAHAIHEMGMKQLDPTFDERLKEAFEQARSEGKWEKTYAVTNRNEYWAEAVQSWFDDNRENDALHNHVDTRDELRQYDPGVARLCEEVFQDGAWRYRKPMQRKPVDRQHLKDVNFDQLPRFRWRKESVTDAPRVLIQTAMGDIEVELDARRAPATVKNFLFYVENGLYSDGSFYRTVTRQNQPQDKVKIEVIQAGADPGRKDEYREPIPLEGTDQTGLRHVAGAISMARAGPDTAQDSFFICLGEQPELDSGGKRNPDGQGFAAFGVVTKGMEVVRKIHQAEAVGQNLKPRVKIQRAIRLH